MAARIPQSIHGVQVRFHSIFGAPTFFTRSTLIHKVVNRKSARLDRSNRVLTAIMLRTFLAALTFVFWATFSFWNNVLVGLNFSLPFL
jgi:hypothetical protein